MCLIVTFKVHLIYVIVASVHIYGIQWNWLVNFLLTSLVLGDEWDALKTIDYIHQCLWIPKWMFKIYFFKKLCYWDFVSFICGFAVRNSHDKQ